ncbi:kinetochore mis14 protein [Rutstroemia sp. NJR-2017a BBW]|nr:kinetochore mis14 protein [Rutstroemia sp. NJR-2017a BBW]
MAEEQRRIELQSPDDLSYLIGNVKRAAKERIDKDLPPIEGEDAMRKMVEEIVDRYIAQTFHTASLNISINGLPPSPEFLDSALGYGDVDMVEEKEEHEPFDAGLWEKAKALAIREEELVEQVAALRRGVPGVVVKREVGWKEVVEGEEKAVGGKIEEVGREDEESGVSLGKGESWERQGNVRKDWEKGVQGLEGLVRGLPEVGARKERAVKAEEYIRGAGRKG